MYSALGLYGDAMLDTMEHHAGKEAAAGVLV
jgi:hypothetical protein